jgi:hypothetical protein
MNVLAGATCVFLRPFLVPVTPGQVWLPNFAGIDTPEAAKLLAVATARLLCDSPAVQASPPLWAALRDALVKKLEGAGRLVGVCLALTARLRRCRCRCGPCFGTGWSRS